MEGVEEGVGRGHGGPARALAASLQHLTPQPVHLRARLVRVEAGEGISPAAPPSVTCVIVVGVVAGTVVHLQHLGQRWCERWWLA